MAASVYPLILFFFFLHPLNFAKSQSFVGVNYGQLADNLPPPSATAKLLKSTTIQKVRLYGSDPGIIKALSNTGIEIIIGTSNGDVSGLASNRDFAKTWIQTNVIPYYPATKITLINVGNEVTTFGTQDLMLQLLPAMRNVQNALEDLSLGGKIKVSTVHTMAVLDRSEPPSAGSFKPEQVDLLKGLLEFNSETGSPFAVNPYPYFAYQGDQRPDTLSFCLFEPNPGRPDPGNNIKYMNMFDAQVDAVRSAMNSLGFKDVEIMVAETGWPYNGDPTEAGATVENAKAYNKNLIAHINSMAGTPLMPGKAIDTYIFALYDENLKPGPASERFFGLFKPDLTMTYDIGLTTSVINNQTTMAPEAPLMPPESPMARFPPAAAPRTRSLPTPPPQVILPSPASPSDKNTANSPLSSVPDSNPSSASSLYHLGSSLSLSFIMFVYILSAIVFF